MAKKSGLGALLAVNLHDKSDLPTYLQLANQIREAILSGQLLPGARLVSTRVLSYELGISRNTALHAYEVLAAEGYLDSYTGNGTFVNNTVPDDLLYAKPPVRYQRDKKTDYSSDKLRLSSRGESIVASYNDLPNERILPFAPDIPDISEFPIQTWLRLMGETAGKLRGENLTRIPNAGYEPLRKAIANHVSVSRGVICDWEQVIVTTGSQQSLDLITRLLLDSDDVVWMEEPGYIRARSIVEASQCKVIGVPVDENGLDINFGAKMYPNPKLIFISPSRQYPLGLPMNWERRLQILEFAKTNSSIIVEDDYDCEFQYFGEPISALQGIDRDGIVFYTGTFSKTLIPTFRLGYVIVPKGYESSFSNARTIFDRHAPLMEQMALAEFIETGRFVSHIRRMRRIYKSRQDSIRKCLFEQTAGLINVPPQLNGTNIIIPLPENSDDLAICNKLYEHNVIVRPLSMFFNQHPVDRPGLILGYAAFDDAQISHACEILTGILYES